MRKVVITGVGIETPMGSTLDEVRDCYLRARSVVSAFPMGTSDKPRAASWIQRDVNQGLPSNLLKMIDRSVVLALHASDRLMADAGLAPGSFDPYRIGVQIGCGVGGVEAMYTTHQGLALKDHMGPFAILKQLPNAPGSHISIRHGIKGESTVHTVACSSAASALGGAFRMIRHGYLDQCIAGGVEAPLGESLVRAWEAMRVLARVDPHAPEATCRPFSRNRTGVVLGEGATLFMLESEEHAKARGARIYATIAGYGASADASHITLPDQAGQVAAMKAVLADAGMVPADIGYINAHGTATGQGDIIETRSTREVFGSRADQTPISSTKAIHGHLLGGSGSIEMLSLLVALNDGVLAPTVNLDEPDPECDLDYVPNAARTGVKVGAALNNSFAFGGSNSCMILTN
jgi:3-oxoacyl-[acyl-carrier-protein] synthase II